ncbi:ADP-ribosylglycohydrolase family protein [Nocardioides humi]|uniref:HEAT repeat domain-containing protein n=1 Tax=Nocardioides humi TaxID=449461 RepID=A0ABN2BE50_9ACTN|nr:ADP-ribosylglycohydrolase family protein [Nocardioides humi]
MMAWTPGMRDRAIEGLSVLARREKWRTSDYGDRIISRVQAALTDENPVVRMHAAEAFTGLHADATSEARVAGLRELLITEPDVMVSTVLLNLLGREAHASPGAVDATLEALAGLRSGADQSSEPQELTDEAEKRSAVDRVEDERNNRKVDIVTFLALTHETPYALSTLNQWASEPAKHNELSHAIPFIRDYLAPGAEPRLQQRTFEFVTTASTSALEYWTATGGAMVDTSELTPLELSELENVLRVLDATADQIYFASGAFESKRGNFSEDDVQQGRATAADIARFAGLATPTLLICAASKAAPVIHHVVEALVYLAQVDEKRSLKALAEAVTAHSNYAYDSLASGVVVPYLTRLVAEQRDLVLFDAEGVDAFKTLLAAFAGAGNEDALELAFTFADVFR